MPSVAARAEYGNGLNTAGYICAGIEDLTVPYLTCRLRWAVFIPKRGNVDSRFEQLDIRDRVVQVHESDDTEHRYLHARVVNQLAICTVFFYRNQSSFMNRKDQNGKETECHE